MPSQSTHITYEDLLNQLRDEKSAVLYAMSIGLIKTSIDCPAGHKVEFRENAKDFKFFRCQQKGCSFKASILKHTWFAKSKLPVAVNLKILYLWAHEYKQKNINHEARLGLSLFY
jgi:hypothetical protein